MNGLHIGTAEKRGRPAPAIIPDSIRDQHIYIAGKTRRGKSTLIQNMVLSDLLNGYGLAVIDPHGDLIEEQILPIIPENRIEDVVLFDPNDTEYPIGFNMFRVSTPRERRQMRSDIGVFCINARKGALRVGSSKRTKSNDLNFPNFAMGHGNPYIVCVYPI